jgi:hypothetical protein
VVEVHQILYRLMSFQHSSCCMYKISQQWYTAEIGKVRVKVRRN